MSPSGKSMLEHVKKEFGGDDALEMWRDILKGFEIGRASCRERV